MAETLATGILMTAPVKPNEYFSRPFLTSRRAQKLRFGISALPVFLRAQNEKLALWFTRNLFPEHTCPCVHV